MKGAELTLESTNSSAITVSAMGGDKSKKSLFICQANEI